jgi:hypothetical protein
MITIRRPAGVFKPEKYKEGRDQSSWWIQSRPQSMHTSDQIPGYEFNDRQKSMAGHAEVSCSDGLGFGIDHGKGKNSLQ